MIYVSLTIFQKINILIYKATGLHWYVTFETISSTVLLFVISYMLVDVFSMYVFAVSMIIVSLYKYIYYQFVGRKKYKHIHCQFMLY